MVASTLFLDFLRADLRRSCGVVEEAKIHNSKEKVFVHDRGVSLSPSYRPN
jgi:hypothetical protein